MLFFYGIWMLCHHGQSPKKGEKSKQRFLGYNEKTHFPFVKSARKPRNVSFLTQNPRFLRIVGYPAAYVELLVICSSGAAAQKETRPNIQLISSRWLVGRESTVGLNWV